MTSEGTGAPEQHDVFIVIARIVDKPTEIGIYDYSGTQVRPLFPWTASAVFISVQRGYDHTFVYVVDRDFVAELRFVVVGVTHAPSNVAVNGVPGKARRNRREASSEERPARLRC